MANSITAPTRDSLRANGTRRLGRSLALSLYLVVFSGSIYLLFGTFEDGSQAGKSGESPLYLGLLFSTYSVMLFQLMIVRVAALSVVLKSTALLMFVFSGTVSLYTAGVASISVMRFCLYIITICAGLLISLRYSLDEFCENFFYTSLAMTTIYLLAYPLLAGRIVYDTLARETVLGITSYAGLFPHKSVAVTFFSISLLISLVRYFGPGNAKNRRLSLALACASFVAILMAGAVGRLLALLVSALVSLFLRAFFRKNTVSLIIIATVLILGTIAYYVVGDSWLYYFGRSWGLTGRDEIFALWPRFFLEKPVFGYGFDGFFTDQAGAPGSYASDLAGGITFATFESVYLDLLIEFGSIGGLCFAFILLSALSKSIMVYRTSISKYKFVPLFLAVWIILGSVLDNGVLHQNALDCVILFWIYFGVERAYKVRTQRPIGRDGAPRRLGSSSKAL